MSIFSVDNSEQEAEENPYGKEFGEIALEGTDYGVGQFVPDLLYEQIVKNYASAKRILGERLIRLVTGYDADTIDRNVRYAEFAKELQERIRQKLRQMASVGLLDEQGMLTKQGLDKASIELLKSAEYRMAGESSRKKGKEGEKTSRREYKKGDSYRDVEVRATIRNAIRTKQPLSQDSLVVSDRTLRQSAVIVFALDASISMKGEKISKSKKAGASLALKALQNKDKVGIIVFGTEIKNSIAPTIVMADVLDCLVRAMPGTQTDITKMLKHAAAMFPIANKKKHLVIITDALPTIGDAPEVVEEAQNAAKLGITITLIGIELDSAGRKLAEKMALVGNGRLYEVKSIDELPTLVLQDYECV